MIRSRRRFLKQAGAVAIGFSGLRAFVACSSGDRLDPSLIAAGFGPLKSDPDKVLDLPDQFVCRVISKMGDRMADGLLVPAAADGMATFEGPDGTTLLLRNHEVNVETPPEYGPFGDSNQLVSKVESSRIYDAGADPAIGPCLGGVTTLVYDTRRQEVVREFLSLAGTLRNCAGGPTPWGTWVTCEESVERAGGACAKDHGYNFEVAAFAQPALVEPIPLRAMGRCNHEAIAVDPNSGILYQTEDRPDGLLYRFICNTPGNLRDGGRLQAMAAVGRPSLDVRNWEEQTVAVGESLDVRWIDLEDVESPEDNLRDQGFAQGCMRFARGEGMWWGDDSAYFACTNGGSTRTGQIWRYRPSPAEGSPEEDRIPGRLELFIEPNQGKLIENADNLTVAPWGDLIVCEDSGGDDRILGVTPEGKIYTLAHNPYHNSEFAGAVFSPDGSTLFVNIQFAGLTLAITGPWTS